MAGIPTLRFDTTPLPTLRRHYRFALARLKAEPSVAALLPDFLAFGPTLSAALQQETDLEDAILDAEALVVTADGGLDRFADRLDVAIRGNKKASTGNPLHQLYFGSETVSRFKRPLLSKELDAAQSWPTLLAQAPQAPLKVLAPDAGPVIQTANTAAKTLDDSMKALAAYNLGGPRKAVFAAYNSLAAKTHGALKAFAHDHPELGLPNNYADTFFLHDSTSPHGKTVAATAIAASKAEAKADTAKKKAADALAKAASDAVAKAEKAKLREAAKAAKKEADDARKKAKEAAAAARKKP